MIISLLLKRLGWLMSCYFACFTLQANEPVANQSSLAPANQGKTLVIESKVSGSQDQPNVIYVMPWQGIKQPITLPAKRLQVALPTLKPISPKKFNTKIKRFYQNKNETN